MRAGAMIHEVEEGDHLSGLAQRYGLPSWKEIWDHPQNAGLREKRASPHVLESGDRVFVPERQTRREPGPTEVRHRFRRRAPRIRLRLDVSELRHASLDGRRGELHVEGRTLPVTVRHGLIEQRIPASTRRVTLLIDGCALVLRVGHLDPVDTTPGQRQRLRNLGYLYGGPRERAAETALDDFGAAIWLFQQDHGLRRDGVCGPRTREKLAQVHGS